MGMDVIGQKPRSENGKYFRANIWWWTPLAGYVTHQHPDLTRHCKYWFSNDGDGLDDVHARMLGERLEIDIASGKVADWAREHNRQAADTPRETCHICHGSGIRTDDVGIEHGMPTRKLEPAAAIETGRTVGWCNACRGLGTRESWAASYQFDEETVREFAVFLKDCGGFQIL